ncbi:hypothetical protein [Armatimonas sp.]|uniref:hypothetical protein n=1 Tax=Armatimonas sp. TaxID=1872638 RepID=UPI00286C8058|nr:hypothetical protein [Armatimonas sp.]
MPVLTNARINAQLSQAEVFYSNAQSNAEIKTLFAAMGVDQTRLQAGVALYQAAQVAVARRAEALGAQELATADFKQKLSAARPAVQRVKTVLQAAFPKDKARLTQLGLGGALPARATEYLESAERLFVTLRANADIAAGLAQYGYNTAKLAEEEAFVLAADAANRVQEDAKGAAQQSTQEQNAALTALKDDLSVLVKLAKVALKDKPALRAALGL